MDLTAEEYCRQIEAYLCRKNDGHLVRIVGPSFEQVCGWAQKGVPIKVAFHGIDRYFERYYAKGPRRRPVRIDFCEADVLDVFDEWRRAVGVPAAEAPPEPAKHASLPAHLDRVIARLTVLRGGDASMDDVIDRIVRELDASRAAAKSLRGEARQALLDRLEAIDRELLDWVRARCDGATIQELERDADAELSPFRDRMPRDAYAQAARACVDRLLRERARLPVVTYQ